MLQAIPDSAVLTVQSGVGVLTAAAVLAYLPAGCARPRQRRPPPGCIRAAGAVGAAGFQPTEQTGCPAVRRSLYLAAQSAVRAMIR